MGVSSFDSAFVGFIFVSVSVSIVDREGMEDLGVSEPLLGLDDGVGPHLPQIDVAPSAPQLSCGELLHNVPSFYVVKSEQVSVQKRVLFLGNAHRKAHSRDR